MTDNLMEEIARLKAAVESLQTRSMDEDQEEDDEEAAANPWEQVLHGKKHCRGAPMGWHW